MAMAVMALAMVAMATTVTAITATAMAMAKVATATATVTAAATVTVVVVTVMVMTATAAAMVAVTITATVNTLNKLNKMTQNQLYLDWKINELEKERMRWKPENSRPISKIQAELRSYRAIQSGNHNNTEFTHTFINGGQREIH